MLPSADLLPHLICSRPVHEIGAGMGRISMATRNELVGAVAERYGRCDPAELGRILDECVRQQVEQVGNAVPPGRSDDAELGEMATKRVDQHRSLPDQQVTRSVVQYSRLLNCRLHRHEPPVRPPDRFADCFGVGRVGLAAANI